MKIAFIIGTRPEVIKASPAIKECQKRGIDFYIISSNQHYDDKMFSNFLEELDFPEVKYKNVEPFGLYDCYHYIYYMLKKEKPDYVWVVGDTDTALVGAFAGYDSSTPVIQCESGVRSFDRRMHEEKNRMMIDRMSTVRFAPTEIALQNLKFENITGHVFHEGNLIVDAVEKALENINNLKPSTNKYIYMTFHRKENIENPKVLNNVIKEICKIKKRIIFSIHPHLKKFGFLIPIRSNFGICSPSGYLESLINTKRAEFIITDSGGIQEEACILGTPCVVLRKTSDRPETIKCGAAILIDPDSKDWKMKFKKKKWKHPYGENVAHKMFDDLEGL